MNPGVSREYGGPRRCLMGTECWYDFSLVEADRYMYIFINKCILVGLGTGGRRRNEEFVFHAYIVMN